MTHTPYSEKIFATLLGGAWADSLGYALETSAAQDIISRYGAAGVTGAEQLLTELETEQLVASDDTQMTLYVLDGLLETVEWANSGTGADPAAAVWLALLRWYKTQVGDFPETAPRPLDRWIDEYAVMKHRRSPAPSILGALQTADMPIVGKPANPEATGCGAVIRSAAFGMLPQVDEDFVVSLARQGAVLTHGSDVAWSAACGYALVMHWLFSGAELSDAVQASLRWMAETPEAGEVYQAVSTAVHEAQVADPVNFSTDLPWVPEQLGGGWHAEEALAIAVYAVLAAERLHDAAGTRQNINAKAIFDDAVRIAVNHGGTSDTTGSLAAQLLGARYGLDVFGGQVPHAPVDLWPVVQEAARRWVEQTQ